MRALEKDRRSFKIKLVMKYVQLLAHLTISPSKQNKNGKRKSEVKEEKSVELHQDLVLGPGEKGRQIVTDPHTPHASSLSRHKD